MTITTTTITGNLTRDPEIRYTRDGQATRDTRKVRSEFEDGEESGEAPGTGS